MRYNPKPRLNTGGYTMLAGFRSTVVLAILCPAGIVIAGESTAPATMLWISMPTGECYLTIHDDGSGQLGYGAMLPKLVAKPGTFEIDTLVTEVQRRRLSSTDVETSDGAQGWVVVRAGAGEEQFPISDAPFALALFTRASENQETSHHYAGTQEERAALVSTCLQTHGPAPESKQP